MGNRIAICLSDEALIQDILNDPIMRQDVGTQTERDVRQWVYEINSQPDHPQRHLKPKGRNLTMNELQSMFGGPGSGGFADFPIVEFDTAFSRTSERNMHDLLYLALSHVGSIVRIYGNCHEWWERSGVKDTLDNRRHFARLSLKSESRFWPLLNPLAKEIDPPGYTAAWPSIENDGTEVRVVLANVNHPYLLRCNTPFYNRWNNDVFRDADGHRYLMTPLIPFGGSGADIAWSIFCRLHQLTGISEQQFSRDYLKR